jgi:hypothetical protein
LSGLQDVTNNGDLVLGVNELLYIRVCLQWTLQCLVDFLKLFREGFDPLLQLYLAYPAKTVSRKPNEFSMTFPRDTLQCSSPE